jgi:hypothetical protein
MEIEPKFTIICRTAGREEDSGVLPIDTLGADKVSMGRTERTFELAFSLV